MTHRIFRRIHLAFLWWQVLFSAILIFFGVNRGLTTLYEATDGSHADDPRLYIVAFLFFAIAAVGSLLLMPASIKELKEERSRK